MAGIEGCIGGVEASYKRDFNTYTEINKYDNRGIIFHRGLLPKSQHHSTIHAEGSYLEGVLRDLENKAHLPNGDLYILNLQNPEKGYSILYGKGGIYYINSKKAKTKWTIDIHKYLESKGKITLGYINGHIEEIIKYGQPTKIVGALFISENCPGEFRYDRENIDRCIYCGESENGSR